jgi:hypothetical protein
MLAVLFLAAFWELYARVRQAHDEDAAGVVPGSTVWLLQHFSAVEEYMVGPREMRGAAVHRSAVRWPDGVRGEFVADRIRRDDAIDAYHVTYEPPRGQRRVVRQPLVRRNVDGAVIDRPEPIVEDSL